MEYEKSMRITGIYIWGGGITHENCDLWKKEIRIFAEITKIKLTENDYKILEYNSDDLRIYFHAMEVLFKGNDLQKINKLYLLLSTQLYQCDLPITISLNYEKHGEDYIH